jgi:hypothetical protein
MSEAIFDKSVSFGLKKFFFCKEKELKMISTKSKQEVK